MNARPTTAGCSSPPARWNTRSSTGRSAARAGAPAALGYGTYDDTIRTLEQALSAGPWLLGERFSAADVYVGSQLGFAMLRKAVDLTPVLSDYVARGRARPAAVRAAGLDDDLAKAA